MEYSERIDRYVMNQMTNDERELFESQLLQDEELRDAVKLHKSVVNSIIRSNAKEFLQGVESSISNKRPRRNYGLWYVASIVVAASIVFGCFMHISVKNTYQDLGYSVALQSDYSRGDDYAVRVIQLVNDKQFDQALNCIEQELAEPMTETVSDEEYEYFSQQHRIKQEDLNWYKAIIYMRMGNYIKAKDLLKQIANNKDGEYKRAAQALLDQL